MITQKSSYLLLNATVLPSELGGFVILLLYDEFCSLQFEFDSFTVRFQ